MLEQYSHNWWLLALRGIAAIIFGILAFVWPGVTFLALVLLFGAYALVDGVFAVISAITHRSGNENRWVLLLEGIVSIAAGLIAWFVPGVGPILASGILGTALAGAALGASTGAVVGGLLRTLIDLGIPEEEARYYNDQIKAGRIIVMARSTVASLIFWDGSPQLR